MGREPSRAQSRRDCLSRKAFQRHTGRDGVSRNGLAAEARARQSETAIPAAYTRTFATLREVPEYSFGRFGRTFSALEARCPDFVPTDRWQLAVEDGRVFLARWGGQAEALGWTARDICSASIHRRRSRIRATAAYLATTRSV